MTNILRNPRHYLDSGLGKGVDEIYIIDEYLIYDRVKGDDREVTYMPYDKVQGVTHYTSIKGDESITVHTSLGDFEIPAISPQGKDNLIQVLDFIKYGSLD